MVLRWEKKFGYPRCRVCSHEGRWSCLACYKCSARGWVSVIGVFIEWKAITKWIAIFYYLPLCSSYLENWQKIVEILCASFCIVTWQSQNRRIYFVPVFLIFRRNKIILFFIYCRSSSNEFIFWYVCWMMISRYDKESVSLKSIWPKKGIREVSNWWPKIQIFGTNFPLLLFPW